MENAPLVAQAIADYTGKTKGELKEMSSEGTITADIIKNAMFASASSIEDRFSKMPKTIGDYWTLIKNKAIRAFTPVIEKISEMINTPQFEAFFNNLVVAIQIAADAIIWLIDGFSWLCQVMEPFAPIIWGIIGALIAYKVYTMLAAAGQAILNAAMMANPAGLIIAGIVALIVILMYFYFTNDQVAYGIIYLWDMLVIGAMTLWLGVKTVFYGLILVGQFFLLGMVGVAYGVLWAWYMFQNGLEAVGVGILYIFQGLYNGVLMIVNGIIDILNKIPGVKIDKAEYASFADEALSGMMDNVTKRNEDLQSMLDDMTEISNSINENKAKFAADLNNSATDIQNKVFTSEQTRQDRVNNRNNWMGDLQNKINGALDMGNSAASKLTNGGKGSIPVKADGGKVDKVDNVSISDEDLKYMKDFAEQEFINKFTTATLAPNVNISFGDVHETVDAEKLKGRIEEILEEELAEVAEGVYD